MNRYKSKNLPLLGLIILFALVVVLILFIVKKSNGNTHDNPSNLETFYVSEVIDGDTIRISTGGSEQKVRLIGVDTPETKNPSKPVECYGPEASAYLSSRLTGRYVSLEADQSQGDADAYGRLLRFVWLDGENINLSIIKGGFGREYTFNLPYKYQRNFLEAENSAKSTHSGLWGACE